MAVAAEGAAATVEGPLHAVADAMRGPNLAIGVELAPSLPPAGAAAELIEAVIQILVENSAQAGAREIRIAAGPARRPHRHSRRRRWRGRALGRQ